MTAALAVGLGVFSSSASHGSINEALGHPELRECPWITHEVIDGIACLRAVGKNSAGERSHNGQR
jgi:hypothetical protein